MDKDLFLNDKLQKLSKSSFRSNFKLSKKDKEYIQSKGMSTIRVHAADFISKRLEPAFISNDGKQTPMRGHPVFVAQHATATCCRGCLEKWYGIKKGTKLTIKQKEFIVDLIMKWISNNM